MPAVRQTLSEYSRDSSLASDRSTSISWFEIPTSALPRVPGSHLIDTPSASGVSIARNTISSQSGSHCSMAGLFPRDAYNKIQHTCWRIRGYLYPHPLRGWNLPENTCIKTDNRINCFILIFVWTYYSVKVRTLTNNIICDICVDNFEV